MESSEIHESCVLLQGNNGDIVWKKANDANLEKEKMLKLARQKAAETR